MLRWSDVDLDAARCRWRSENDKIGYEHVTPLSDESVAALTAARAEQRASGDAWVFPGSADSSKPCSRHLLRD